MLSNHEDGISYYDFETVYSLCTDYLDGYYYCITGEKEINRNSYFAHENLIYYMTKIIEETRFSSASKIDQMKHGLVNIDWNIDHQYVYLSVATNVIMDYGGGFADINEFLVQNQNVQLFIVDR